MFQNDWQVAIKNLEDKFKVQQKVNTEQQRVIEQLQLENERQQQTIDELSVRMNDHTHDVTSQSANDGKAIFAHISFLIG